MPIAEIAVGLTLTVAVIQVVTFFMARGRADAKSDDAHAAAITALAKSDLVAQRLAEFRTEVAEKYVAIASMDKVERHITEEMHRLSDQLGQRVDGLHATLTSTLIEAFAKVTPEKITKR